MEHTFESAQALIMSLKVGDKVRLTRDGRTNEMYVSVGPRRSDGAYGSPESLHVTVTFGPGRYATEVGVDHLWRRRKGHGYIGGGTELVRIDDEDPFPVDEVPFSVPLSMTGYGSQAFQDEMRREEEINSFELRRRAPGNPDNDWI